METFDHDFVSKIDADPFGDQQKDFDDSTFEEDDDDEEMKLLLAELEAEENVQKEMLQNASSNLEQQEHEKEIEERKVLDAADTLIKAERKHQTEKQERDHEIALRAVVDIGSNTSEQSVSAMQPSDTRASSSEDEQQPSTEAVHSSRKQQDGATDASARDDTPAQADDSARAQAAAVIQKWYRQRSVEIVERLWTELEGQDADQRIIETEAGHLLDEQVQERGQRQDRVFSEADELLQTDAACHIQRLFRRHQRKVKESIAASALKERRERIAASIIQEAYRSYKRRCSVKNIQQAILEDEALQKDLLADRPMDYQETGETDSTRIKDAALVIQRRYRQYRNSVNKSPGRKQSAELQVLHRTERDGSNMSSSPKHVRFHTVDPLLINKHSENNGENGEKHSKEDENISDVDGPSYLQQKEVVHPQHHEVESNIPDGVHQFTKGEPHPHPTHSDGKAQAFEHQAFEKHLTYEAEFSIPQEPCSASIRGASSRLPSKGLQLEHIYGYNGTLGSRNLFYNRNEDSIAYSIACVGCIMNKQSRTQRLFNTHTEEISALCMDADKGMIATGQIDPSLGLEAPVIYVWEVLSTRIVAELVFHSTGVQALQFLKNGERLISLGLEDPQCIAIWHVPTETLLTHFTVGYSQCSDKIVELTANPCFNGEFVSRGRKCLQYWNEDSIIDSTDSVRAAWTSTSDSFTCSAFASGHCLVVGHEQGHLLLFDSKGGMTTRSAHETRVDAICSTTQFVVSICTSKRVIVWSSRMSKCRELELGFVGLPASIGSVCAMDCSRNASQVIIGTTCNRIYEVEFATSKLVCVVSGHAQALHCLSCHPRLQFLASGDAGGVLKIFDAESYRLLKQTQLSAPIQALDFSSDGSLLAIAFSNGAVSLLGFPDLAQRRHLQPSPSAIEVIAFSPQGKFLVIGDSTGAVSLLSLTTCQVVHSLKLESKISSIDFSADGSILSASDANYDNTYWNIGSDTTWDTLDGDLEWNSWQRLKGQEVEGLPANQLNCIRSRASDILVSSDTFGRLSMYRFPCVSRRAQSRVYTAHSSAVCSLQFTADDVRFLSAGELDTALCQWRLVPYRELQREQKVEAESQAEVVHESDAETQGDEDVVDEPEQQQQRPIRALERDLMVLNTQAPASHIREEELNTVRAVRNRRSQAHRKANQQRQRTLYKEIQELKLKKVSLELSNRTTRTRVLRQSMQLVLEHCLLPQKHRAHRRLKRLSLRLLQSRRNQSKATRDISHTVSCKILSEATRRALLGNARDSTKPRLNTLENIHDAEMKLKAVNESNKALKDRIEQVEVEVMKVNDDSELLRVLRQTKLKQMKLLSQQSALASESQREKEQHERFVLEMRQCCDATETAIGETESRSRRLLQQLTRKHNT